MSDEVWVMQWRRYNGAMNDKSGFKYFSSQEEAEQSASEARRRAHEAVVYSFISR